MLNKSNKVTKPRVVLITGSSCTEAATLASNYEAIRFENIPGVSGASSLFDRHNIISKYLTELKSSTNPENNKTHYYYAIDLEVHYMRDLPWDLIYVVGNNMITHCDELFDEQESPLDKESFMNIIIDTYEANQLFVENCDEINHSPNVWIINMGDSSFRALVLAIEAINDNEEKDKLRMIVREEKQKEKGKEPPTFDCVLLNSAYIVRA